ncbi:3-oxoacyl-ACP reductase [Actinomycetospora sp. NBRC 106375]|uniref:SDR family oxidoreductase n=1 Tax=Actinomycetospora sp. NBRC 106375 TaxID=3032207 RepID=UPI0024A4C3BD|nr:SDR family oxidoreductase [Actinomycetospora sp. NBRC 106375]GLZ49330.1 3-oxoacyl-ACP reductase [Actinomycetospora sp. NBRC 106375]
MELGLTGRTALVCASTSGLGRATATALAHDGATVVVSGRSDERARDVAAGLPGAVGIGADLVAPGGAEALFAATVDRVGTPDVLVLNGPGPAPGTARDVDADGIATAIATLVAPHRVLVELALPAMLEQGWGRVLSISSSSVEAPIPGLALSNLGRAALAGYLKTLAGEVAASGVTVNSLLPGRIATPRAEQIDTAVAERTRRSREEVERETRATIPAGRYGDPVEFGAAAAFLCSAPAAYITGTALRCDGGMVPTL